MQPLLQGKIVCVTGASRGIGRAIALECAESGADVVVHYLGDADTTAEAQSLVQEIESKGRRAVSCPGDISNPDTAALIVSTAVSTFGRIDVLVSNAGICPFYSFLDMPHDIWKLTRSVNLDGTFFVVQAVANQMKSQTPQGGSIVAISSISALVGGGMQCHYTPTKAGVLSLMQSCAIALGPFNIRCNALLPGTIATEFVSPKQRGIKKLRFADADPLRINREDLSDPKKREYMANRIPLGRLGEPADLAGPAVFLASDMARYVTGSSLLVDGGMFVNLQ